MNEVHGNIHTMLEVNPLPTDYYLLAIPIHRHLKLSFNSTTSTKETTCISPMQISEAKLTPKTWSTIFYLITITLEIQGSTLLLHNTTAGTTARNML